MGTASKPADSLHVRHGSDFVPKEFVRIGTHVINNLRDPLQQRCGKQMFSPG